MHVSNIDSLEIMSGNANTNCNNNEEEEQQSGLSTPYRLIIFFVSCSKPVAIRMKNVRLDCKPLNCWPIYPNNDKNRFQCIRIGHGWHIRLKPCLDQAPGYKFHQDDPIGASGRTIHSLVTEQRSLFDNERGRLSVPICLCHHRDSLNVFCLRFFFVL